MDLKSKHSKFSPSNTLDGDSTTYWATDDNIFPASLEIELNEKRTFDRILIQEPIRFGQRISEFGIDVMGDTSWKSVFKGTTIGYKRILRIPSVSTKKIRLRFTEANNTVAISNVGLYKPSLREELK
jgi:alpha-L-fucosidase